MSSGCGDVLSLADLQTAKKHQIFEAEVITGKSGGVAGGSDIDYATNQVTGQVQKTMPAILRDIGFTPASFDFTTGGALSTSDRDKVVYDPVSKTWYSYAGTLPVVVPAAFNPVGNADWKPQTDPTLRAELADASSGPNLIGYSPSTTYDPGTVGEALGPYAATGATNKFSKEDRANRQIYSDDFGSPTVDSGISVNLALDYMKTQGDPASHGGVVHIPRGYRTVDTSIVLDRYGSSDVTDNITISGEGAGTSELRAGAGMIAANTPVIRDIPATGGNYIQQLTLSDFSIRGGYNGIRLSTASRTNIHRVKVENTTNDGVYIRNSWVNVYSGILVSNAGSNGVNFDPAWQKTSTAVTSGYVNTTVGAGWVWGFMNYSVATAVAADNAGSYGHHIKNSECFVMTGCGNESAQRSGIFAEASSAIGPNQSILIQGHFSHNSNLSNEGWANLLHARSQDGVANRITIRESTSHAPNFGVPDIIADGVGTIVVNDNNITPNGVRTYNGGYIDHVHHTLLINSVSIPAATATAICNLGSTQGHTTNVSAETSAFAGKITVLASTSNPSVANRRIAIYELFVCVSVDLGKQVTQIASLGFVSGSVPASPSFTWSINSANRLVATPIGNSAGTFWFEVTTDSQVKASNL